MNSKIDRKPSKTRTMFLKEPNAVIFSFTSLTYSAFFHLLYKYSSSLKSQAEFLPQLFVVSRSNLCLFYSHTHTQKPTCKYTLIHSFLLSSNRLVETLLKNWSKSFKTVIKKSVIIICY